MSTPTLTDKTIAPGDAGYDEARTVWNAMIDHRPQLIVRCAGTADVVAAVRIARDRDLEIGVRCGGHNIAGLAVPDGGLMIDLRPMGQVQVDPQQQRAHVQGGALLGALDRAAQRFGLATTAGNVSHTGVGGLTLGGGMGWLARRHGLTCDNVIAYTLVTAEGEVVRVTKDEQPDLFWGLRGGGGNFGIVTEFAFRLHPVGTRTLVADLSFPIAEAQSALQGWRELAIQAPPEATFTATVEGGKVQLGYVWVGDPSAGRRLLPALRALGHPTTEEISEPTYLELQTRDDDVEGRGGRQYWKGHFLPGLPDGAIAGLLADCGRDDGPSPTLSLQTYGGAIADALDGDTAFSYRDTQFEYVASSGWTDADADTDTAQIDAIRRCAARIAPYAAGAYVNALNGEGVGRAYTPHKLARLTALKDTYDPDNVFHLNHNIIPSRHQVIPPRLGA